MDADERSEGLLQGPTANTTSDGIACHGGMCEDLEVGVQQWIVTFARGHCVWQDETA